jgi:hypothetical protein
MRHAANGIAHAFRIAGFQARAMTGRAYAEKLRIDHDGRRPLGHLLPHRFSTVTDETDDDRQARPPLRPGRKPSLSTTRASGVGRNRTAASIPAPMSVPPRPATSWREAALQ